MQSSFKLPKSDEQSDYIPSNDESFGEDIMRFGNSKSGFDPKAKLIPFENHLANNLNDIR